jgi:protein-S-isoprenylcysteine O-methyltransferase Ste14
MIPLPLHFAFVLFAASPFLYFITAGAKTFTVPELRDTGASIGQTSFLSGAFGVLGVGLFRKPEIFHELFGSGLTLCSMVLYEWTRRTILGKVFYVGLGGEVPSKVCEQGPYRYVRHPLYMSYIAAFLGMVVAFPSAVTGMICILNICLLFTSPQMMNAFWRKARCPRTTKSTKRKWECSSPGLDGFNDARERG